MTKEEQQLLEEAIESWEMRPFFEMVVIDMSMMLMLLANGQLDEKDILMSLDRLQKKPVKRESEKLRTLIGKLYPKTEDQNDNNNNHSCNCSNSCINKDLPIKPKSQSSEGSGGSAN